MENQVCSSSALYDFSMALDKRIRSNTAEISMDEIYEMADRFGVPHWIADWCLV